MTPPSAEPAVAAPPVFLLPYGAVIEDHSVFAGTRTLRVINRDGHIELEVRAAEDWIDEGVLDFLHGLILRRGSKPILTVLR